MNPIPTDDNSLTLYSEAYQENYHCRGGAFLKARDIFLAPMLETYGDNTFAKKRRVLEAGFGAGLNFFVTANTFMENKAELEYVALEKDLLPADVFQQLRYDKLTSKPIVETFIKAREQLSQPLLEYSYNLPITQSINLQLIIGEALETQLPVNHFDWVYLDAFSPANNPELWSEPFIAKLYNALKDGGGLSTYSVNGEVRRIMKRLGFTVEKRPGIPGKREVLAAWKFRGSGK